MSAAVQPPPPRWGGGTSIIDPPKTIGGGGGGSDSTGHPPPRGTGGDDSGAGQAWGFLGGFAAVVLPLAVLSETLAYLFNLGWAVAFSIPIWLVPASGPPVNALLCGTAVVVVFVAWAFINARRTWLREIGEHEALVASLPAGTVGMPRKPSYQWPELNFETLQLTVRAGPLEVLASLAILAVLSTVAGSVIARSRGSWSFIDSKCIVVAAYGDVLIASDAEKLARSDGVRRVAPDFTVYRSDAIPQFWNEDARLAVIESDSARAHRPMLECPKPPTAPSRSSSQPRTRRTTATTPGGP